MNFQLVEKTALFYIHSVWENTCKYVEMEVSPSGLFTWLKTIVYEEQLRVQVILMQINQ